MKKVASAVVIVFVVMSVLVGCAGNGELKEMSKEAIGYLAEENEEGFKELFHPNYRNFDFDVYKKSLPLTPDELSEAIKRFQTLNFHLETVKSGETRTKTTSAEYKVVTESKKTYYIVAKYLIDGDGDGFSQFSVTLVGSDKK